MLCRKKGSISTGGGTSACQVKMIVATQGYQVVILENIMLME